MKYVRGLLKVLSGIALTFLLLSIFLFVCIACHSELSIKLGNIWAVISILLGILTTIYFFKKNKYLKILIIILLFALAGILLKLY